MNWLCWHVGTVTDPKFGRIADALKTPRVNVIGVWAVVLEKAKDGRGLYSLNSKDAGYALGITPDLVDRIHAEFQAEGLVDCGEVVNWEKRQHGGSAKRMAAKRARDAAASQPEQRDAVTERDVTLRHVSPTDRQTVQTDIQTDRQTTTHYAASDLSERVEAALCQDMPVFGLTAACDMLMGEGFTESDILDAARSIAARGKRRVNPNYFIQAARGMKDDASRPTPAQSPRKLRYNPADTSSPDAVAERRSKIAAGMREAFPGLGGASDPGTGG